MKKANVCKVISIFLALVFMLSFFGCASQQGKSIFELSFQLKEQNNADQSPVEIEDQRLLVSVDPQTLEITVTDHMTNQVWSSYVKAEEALTDEELNHFRNLLSVRFYDKQDTEFILDSWKDCVQLNQYSIEKQNNRIYIKMVLGKLGKKRVLPEAIRKSEFEKVIGKIESDRAKRRMNAFYRLYDLSEAVDEKQKNEWLSKYSYLAQEPIYVLQNGVTDRERDELETYMIQAGYTYEDVEKEMALVAVAHKKTEYPAFEIPLCLTIENGSFIAELVSKEIRYDTEKYHLNEISLLPYFAKTSESDGYLFFPDNAGAIIDLDAPKIRSASVISARIYGNDLSVNSRPSDIHCKIPVFGTGDSHKSVIGIVEEGEAKGKITAEYIRTVNRSNYCYATYIHHDFLSTESADVSATALNLASYEKSKPVDRFKVRYLFGDKDYSYSGMAHMYRDYLSIANDADKAFTYCLETLGGLNTDSEFALLPVKKTVPLTTIEQSGELIEQLHNNGIKQIDLSLSGALGGGLNHYYLKNLNFDGKIGSQKEFKRLADKTAKLGDLLSLEFNFGLVYRQKAFDGFSPSQKASRTLNNYVTKLFPVNPATNDLDYRKSAYLVEPKLTIQSMLRAAEELKKLAGKQHIRVSDLGGLLASNHQKSPTGRQEVKALYQNMFEQLSQDHLLSFDTGNAYVFPYADRIYKLEYSNSGHKDFDAVVPFIQMVLHGSIGYTTTPINLEANEQNAVLSCIESGSMPLFTFAKQNLSELKDSVFSKYVSVSADYHLQRSAQIYQEIEAAIGDLATCKIISHQTLFTDLKEVVYDNGVKILVNYGDSPQEVSGKTVKPKSFLRIG